MSAPSGLASLEKRLLWILVALAWLLRAGVVLEYEARHPLADRPVIDEAAYERWALEIAGGDWVGHGVFFQDPLYPYWLGSVYSVFGGGAPDGRATALQRSAARQLQCVLGALTVLFTALVARRLFGPTAALVSAAALATYGPLLVLPACLLKPNLLLPLLSGLVLLLLRTRTGERARPRSLLPWLLAGVLAGAGALLRGNVLLLLPVFVALPFLRRIRSGARSRLADTAASALATLAGVVLVLAPVALRNLAVGGVLALTTSGAGTNVYGGNAESNPWGVATELDWVRGIPEHEAEDWRHEAERRTGRELDPGEVSRFWLGEALRSFRREPLLHLRILAHKLWLTLGRYEVPDNHHVGWDARFLRSLAPWPGYGLWGWLGLAGMLLFLARREALDARGAGELLALYALYLGTIVLTVTSMRVRLALVPLLVPFAGRLVASTPGIGAWLGRRLGDVPRAATWQAIALCLGLSAPVVFWIPFDAATRERELSERDFNLAVYALEDGELEHAAELADALEDAYPGTSRVETLQAEIATRRALRVLGDEGSTPDERRDAIDDVRGALGRLRAVATDPAVGARERFRARKLAGFIQLEIDHDPAAAARHFRAALAFDPDDAEVLEALARAEAQLAQPPRD